MSGPMAPFMLSAGVNALSNLFQGISGFFGATHEAQALKNASIQTGLEAGSNIESELISGDQATAAAATAVAANGGGFVGSNMGAIRQISDRAMFGARAQAYRAQTQEQNDLYQSSLARAQATDSAIQGVLGSGVSLSSGFMRGEANKQYLQGLSKLRGAGQDSPYDWMPMD
ncbi:MAG: hypothetical protein ACREEW_18155 [Caulobacteraceae bacterium]